MERMLYMLLLCGAVVTSSVSNTGIPLDVIPLEYPPSPCPGYFQYMYNHTRGASVGYIRLPVRPEWSRFELEVNMTVYGNVYFFDTIKINPLPHNFSGPNTPLEYEVTFPHNTKPPYLTLLKFNGYEVCKGPSLEHIKGLNQSTMFAKSTIITQSATIPPPTQNTGQWTTTPPPTQTNGQWPIKTIPTETYPPWVTTTPWTTTTPRRISGSSRPPTTPDYWSTKKPSTIPDYWSTKTYPTTPDYWFTKTPPTTTDYWGTKTPPTTTDQWGTNTPPMQQQTTVTPPTGIKGPPSTPQTSVQQPQLQCLLWAVVPPNPFQYVLYSKSDKEANPKK